MDQNFFPDGAVPTVDSDSALSGKVFNDRRSSLEIVLKINERCNINCTYCYMYNLASDVYKDMPNSASVKTCEDVARFICSEFQIRSPRFVRIVLHGGEPMLLPPRQMERRLRAMYAIFTANMPEEQVRRIQLSMQTNATLITDEWLELIAQWKIKVGVSLDGPAAVHDARRIDKAGRGTHAQTMKGIQRLLDESRRSKIGDVGVLCVINPDADGGEVYRYLVDEVGIRGFDFLYPFMNWDNYDQVIVAKTRSFLEAALKEWIKDVRQGRLIRVRTFLKALSTTKFIGMEPPKADRIKICHNVVVVESDGSVMPEESLRLAYKSKYMEMNIAVATVQGILEKQEFIDLIEFDSSLSQECTGCVLLAACRSGRTLGRIGMRYSTSEGYRRKSVYCDAYIGVYVHMKALVNAAARSEGGRKLIGRLERSIRRA